MTTKHNKSLSRMSVEMTEDAGDAGIKAVLGDHEERIIVSALEETKIRKAVSSRRSSFPRPEAQVEQ